MSYDLIDYTDFINNSHYLDTLDIEEDCGKYSLKLRSQDFIYFDRILTNEPHKHDFYEMCLILNGTGLYTHNGIKYKLSSGDLILSEPHTTHEISSFETKDLYLVYMIFTIDEANIPLSNKNEDILLSNFIKSHEFIIHDASLLFHYLPMLLVNNNGKGCSLSKIITTKAWFFDCISRLSDGSLDSNINEKNNKNVDMAVAYIMQNIRTNVKVNDVAKNAYVSERHLRHLFKKYYNMSVTEFIQKRKILLAENKLRMGFRVNEAASYVGIYNASQFSKLFKKINGVTPKAYNDLFSKLKSHPENS